MRQPRQKPMSIEELQRLMMQAQLGGVGGGGMPPGGQSAGMQGGSPGVPGVNGGWIIPPNAQQAAYPGEMPGGFNQAGFAAPYPGEQPQDFYQPDWGSITGPTQERLDRRAAESLEEEAEVDSRSPESRRERRRERRQGRQQNRQQFRQNLGDMFRRGVRNLFTPFNRYGSAGG